PAPAAAGGEERGDGVPGVPDHVQEVGVRKEPVDELRVARVQRALLDAEGRSGARRRDPLQDVLHVQPAELPEPVLVQEPAQPGGALLPFRASALVLPLAAEVAEIIRDDLRLRRGRDLGVPREEELDPGRAAPWASHDEEGAEPLRSLHQHPLEAGGAGRTGPRSPAPGLGTGGPRTRGYRGKGAWIGPSPGNVPGAGSGPGTVAGSGPGST